MRRREFISSALATAAVSFDRTASAQNPTRMLRIAIVAAASKIEDLSINGGQPPVRAYFTELQKLGYVEGKNLVVERYSALGRRDRFPELARAVVESAPDLILTYTAALVQEISPLTTTIPIVAGISDPVGLGLITSLAASERNITGVSGDIGFEVWGKRFQLLREAAGRLTNIRFLVIEAESRSATLGAGVLRQAAKDAGVSFDVAVVGGNIDRSAYERVFAAIARERTDGLVVENSTDHYVYRALIAQLAAGHRIPAIYSLREFVEAGGLLSYGADTSFIARRLAGMTGQILRGAKPGDIPFDQQTKFELVLNRATAKSLALEFPSSLLATADIVVE